MRREFFSKSGEFSRTAVWITELAKDAASHFNDIEFSALKHPGAFLQAPTAVYEVWAAGARVWRHAAHNSSASSERLSEAISAQPNFRCAWDSSFAVS